MTASAAPEDRPAFDHDRLHRCVRRSALAGAGSGLVAHAGGWLAGAEAVAPVLLVGAAAGCAGALAAAAPHGARRHVLAAIAVTLLAGALAREHAAPYTAFGTLLLGGAVGLSPGWRLPLRAAALALVAGIAATGLAWSAAAPLAASALAAWMPPWAALSAAGAALGFLLSFGVVPRLLARPDDPVAEAFEALGGSPPGPAGTEGALDAADGPPPAPAHGPAPDAAVRDLAARAAQAHRATLLALAACPPEDAGLTAAVARASEDLALSVMAVAGRCLAATPVRTPSDEPAALAGRLADLEARAGKAADPVAARGYERARDQVRTLAEHHERLAAGRDRLEAHLHQQVATLESLRLSCLHLRSADAQRFACEVSPLLDRATALSADAADQADAGDVLLALA